MCVESSKHTAHDLITALNKHTALVLSFFHIVGPTLYFYRKSWSNPDVEPALVWNHMCKSVLLKDNSSSLQLGFYFCNFAISLGIC